MRCSRIAAFLTLATTIIAAPTIARAQEAARADTSVLPIKPTRTVRFTTDEGTWISLDVSPDGRSIVFDLVGDLYVLPIAGGTARRLTSGTSWDCMPRFSPDGKSIAFISDRSGSDNLWVVNIGGSGARVITKETDFALSSPAWSPDGDYLVVRKFGPYPGPVDYLRSVPLWLYHKNGGSGTELWPGRGTLTTNTGGAFSPDGKTVYFASHTGGYAGANLGRYQVMAFNRETGDTQTLTSNPGGGLRPIASPDGKYLVYATRHDGLTGLRIRDLTTLNERWLLDRMQRDDQEGYAPNDILPGYAFTPDSRAVVFTGDGKIKRVDVATGEVTVIPFTAEVEQGIASRHRVPLRIDDSQMSVTQMLSMNQSPDGRRVTFGAVAHVWVADLGAAPRRLTTVTQREYQPAFSPDGQWITYVTWSDTAGGYVWKIRATGGTPVMLTRDPGYYSNPTWSADGSKIVYNASSVGAGVGDAGTGSELRWISVNGGAQQRVLRTGAAPALVTSGAAERVFFTEGAPAATPGGPGATVVVSTRLDGTDKRSHARLTSSGGGGFTIRVSPDQRWLLILDRDDAYVMALTSAGSEGLPINVQSPSVPLRRLTNEGANYIAWANDGKTITWNFANRFYRVPLDTVMKYERRADWKPDSTVIALQVARSIPQGSFALRNARILTMKGEEVIERGDVVVQNNRIVAVGPAGQVTIPSGARSFDVTGKTIIPGLIDVHAHPRVGREIPPDQEWSIAANLAYGVTTTRNPSGSRGSFPWYELVETGELVGPRIYATGPPLTFTQIPVRNYDDALHVVRRYKAQGANSLKQYLQPRRVQRQWILQAAIAENMNITNEGAGDLKADVTMALDGYTGFEHTLPIVPIYKDLIQVFAAAGITYTPAMIVAYGGPESLIYWQGKSDLHADEKLRRFTPHGDVDGYTRRKQVYYDEEFIFPLIAKAAADIVHAGGSVGLGSHGNQQGLGAQWELWNLSMGGLKPMEVLRITSIMGAESIGLDRDIGSLEAGKMADMLVLNGNPLENIRNTNNIQWVIKNGEIYNAETLDRLWPSPKPFGKFFWVSDLEQLLQLRRKTTTN